jgi:hypothetical protein
MKTPKPGPPTPQSVEPKRNMKEVELENVRLLLQVIAEAKAFRPDKQERHGK